MEIELDSDRAQAGAIVGGRVVADDGPMEAEVWLERREGDRHKTAPASAAAEPSITTERGTGRFELAVPADAEPSWRSGNAQVTWLVIARRAGRRGEATDDEPSWLDQAVGSTRSVLSVPVWAEVTIGHEAARPLDPELAATAGTDPPRLKRAIGEHFLSMFMGLAFTGMFVAAGIALLVVEGEGDPATTRAVGIGALLFAIIPLIVLYLAVRTVWPRRPSGIELQVDPAVVAPGETFTATLTGGRPVTVEFLTVETYWTSFGVDSVLNKNPHRRRVGANGQFATTQRQVAKTRLEVGTPASFTVPTTGVATYFGELVQYRWVLRVGRGKIGRWGPIKMREWHVVVGNHEPQTQPAS